VQAPHRERPHDVLDAFHQRPDAGEHEIQATPPPAVVRAKLWMLASANISPTRTPTVVIEAESN
jgi:hypothetical protein